jgi:hypothetical protein
VEDSKRGTLETSKTLAGSRRYRGRSVDCSCRFDLGEALSKPAPFQNPERVRHPNAKDAGVMPRYRERGDRDLGEGGAEAADDAVLA